MINSVELKNAQTLCHRYMPEVEERKMERDWLYKKNNGLYLFSFRRLSFQLKFNIDTWARRKYRDEDPWVAGYTMGWGI